ncbi:MAG: substrate-binding periplasmic protein [Promethearchaeota archaeon]
MKREIAVVAMVACLAGGFLAGWFIPPLFEAPSGELVSKIKSRGELRVGTSADYPPFEFYNDTDIVGFDVDVCTLIADEIGVDLEMVHMDFDALIGACAAGTIDMVAAALTYDPTTEIGQQRAKQLAPSIPYITVAQVVVTLGSSGLSIANLSDLASLGINQVGCQSGTVMESELISAGVTPATFASALLLMQDLVSGTGVQAVYIDEPVFTSWNNTYDLKIIFTTGTDPMSLWCRHEDPDLLYVINTVILKGYELNGTMYTLLAKWFE